MQNPSNINIGFEKNVYTLINKTYLRSLFIYNCLCCVTGRGDFVMDEVYRGICLKCWFCYKLLRKYIMTYIHVQYCDTLTYSVLNRVCCCRRRPETKARLQEIFILTPLTFLARSALREKSVLI